MNVPLADQLTQQLRGVLRRADLRPDELEVLQAPRPTGGSGLCVDFAVPVAESEGVADACAQVMLAFLIQKKITRNRSAIQFGANVLCDGKYAILKRYFLEGSSLRDIETQPKKVMTTRISELIRITPPHVKGNKE